MDSNVKRELVMESASKVHEAWCEGELKAFYERFMEAYKGGANFRESLEFACNKNGKIRNYAKTIDVNFLMSHSVMVDRLLQTFEGFKKVLESLDVKRFTKRNLTPEEQIRADNNYNAETKEENILRDFYELFSDSQAENMNAAISAVNVYEAYAKRGYTIEQLKSEEMRDEIGTLIHADWMKRNKINKSNENLFVPFKELDDWTKQQDLDVFFAMLDVVEKSPEKYGVEKQDGLSEEINVEVYERQVLDEKDNEMYWLHNTDINIDFNK